MFIERNITKKLEHFKGKLLFISGPRQSGKTFIIENKLKPDLVINMDVAKDRLFFKKFPDTIIEWYKTNFGQFPPTSPLDKKPLVFLDEIHKVRGWRNIIKGTFDKTNHAIDYIASGSSAFKIRKQDRGDSLAGRAIWLNLFPISFREYIASSAPDIRLPPAWKGRDSAIDKARECFKYQGVLRKLWEEYIKFGSFPENLVRKDEIFYKKWLEDYLAAMLDRDLKDLHSAKDSERVFQVFQLLLEGIGSTYSARSLSETLEVSPNTIKSDVRSLRQVLWGFELPVATVSKAKQIRKEKKFYPIDFCFTNYQWPLIEGGHFECIVACLLMRSLFSETSSVISQLNLGFFRDYNKNEVDFILQDKRKIYLAAECKLKSKGDTSNLRHFKKYNPRESIMIVEEPGIFESSAGFHKISIELLAATWE